MFLSRFLANITAFLAPPIGKDLPKVTNVLHFSLTLAHFFP